MKQKTNLKEVYRGVIIGITLSWIALLFGIILYFEKQLITYNGETIEALLFFAVVALSQLYLFSLLITKIVLVLIKKRFNLKV